MNSELRIKMMEIINKEIDKRIKIKSFNINVKNWKVLKNKEPDKYKEMVNEIFDELHPY